MMWDTWFCPNQSCATQLWLAQRCSEQQDDWLIGPSVTVPAWRFAGPLPICPLCGTTLITPIDWVTGRVGLVDCDGRIDRRERAVYPARRYRCVDHATYIVSLDTQIQLPHANAALTTADQTGMQPWPYACDHYSCAPTQKDEAQHEDTNH